MKGQQDVGMGRGAEVKKGRCRAGMVGGKVGSGALRPLCVRSERRVCPAPPTVGTGRNWV